MPTEAKAISTTKVRYELALALRTLITRAPGSSDETYCRWLYHVQALCVILEDKYDVILNIGGPQRKTAERYREAEESNARQKIQRVEQQYKEKLGEKEAEATQATAVLQANKAKRVAVGKTVAAQARTNPSHAKTGKSRPMRR